MAITEEELKAYGDDDPNALEELIRFEDGVGNVKWLRVEDMTEEDVLSGDDFHDLFPSQEQPVVDNETDADSTDENPKEKRSIVMPAESGTFETKGGDASLRIDRAKTQSMPPKTAKYVVFLLPKACREVVLGDLTEQYPVVRNKRGKLFSHCWFYRQVFSSIWPLIAQVVNKLACRLTK